jgi:hypothetical protein
MFMVCERTYEDSMNSFLSTTLVISGVVDLAAAGLLMAAFNRGVDRSPTLVALALGALGAAALKGLAIRWIQKERQEAYPLSIALGAIAAVVGLGAFVAGGLSFDLWKCLVLAGAGLLLGIVSLVSMNAPSVITDLRIPASRDQRQTARRPVGRDRGRDRDMDRRRGRGGREGRDARHSEVGRGGRHTRETLVRSGAPDRVERPERPDRGESPERRDRPDRPERGPRPERGERGDRGERRDRMDRGERDRRRPPIVEPGEGRGLSVVVSGTPPPTVPLPGRQTVELPRVQRPETPPIEERLNRRPDAGAPRPRVEIPPMRPLRSDTPPPETSEEYEAPAVEERREQGERPERGDRGDRGDRDRRGRRRRGGRGGSRSGYGERRDDRGAPSEDRSDVREGDGGLEPEAPPRPRYEPVTSEPRAFPPVEAEPRRVSAGPVDDDGPIGGPIGPIGPIETDGPIGPVGRVMDQEPIDRISGFSARPSGDEARPGPAPVTEFGRIKKPVLAGRKGKHSKPRENRVHRGLGSSMGGGEAAEQPAPARRAAPEGRIGMPDGIGPVDLGESSSDQND